MKVLLNCNKIVVLWNWCFVSLFCCEDFKGFFHKFCLLWMVTLSLLLGEGSGSHNKVSKLWKCEKQAKGRNPAEKN